MKFIDMYAASRQDAKFRASSNYDLLQNFLFEELDRNLKEGGDPNEAGRNGDAVIFFAAEHPELQEGLEILIRNGASTTIRDSKGKSVIDVMIENRNVEGLRLLLPHMRMSKAELDAAISNAKYDDVKSCLRDFRNRENEANPSSHDQ